jgi:hypothetical protein
MPPTSKISNKKDPDQQATLLFPSRKAEEMWDEIYVRQNTGIGMAKAIDH